MHAQQAILQLPKGLQLCFQKATRKLLTLSIRGRETLLIMINRRGTKCQEKLLEKMIQHRSLNSHKNVFELFPSITLSELSLLMSSQSIPYRPLTPVIYSISVLVCFENY
jgi:hypothetical protein